MHSGINYLWLFVALRDVKLEYKHLKEKVREYNKKDAEFYSNIFCFSLPLRVLHKWCQYN